jgi:hypothetical protein
VVKISAPTDQGKIYLLHKVVILSRSKNIFLGWKFPNDHEIFLHGKVWHDPRNIWEFSWNILSHKNDAYFIAH